VDPLQIGGYTAPFVVFGLIMLFIGLIALYWMPEVPEVRDTKASSLEVTKELVELLHIPRVILFFTMAFLTLFGTGFVTTNLGADLVQVCRQRRHANSVDEKCIWIFLVQLTPG